MLTHKSSSQPGMGGEVAPSQPDPGTPRDLPLWKSFGGKIYVLFAAAIAITLVLMILGSRDVSEVKQISAEVVEIAVTHDLVQELAVRLADLDAAFYQYTLMSNRETFGRVSSQIRDIRSVLGAIENRIDGSSALAREYEELLTETEAIQGHIQTLISSDPTLSTAESNTIVELRDNLTEVRSLYARFSADSAGLVDDSIGRQTETLWTLSVHLTVSAALILAALVAASLYIHKSVRAITDVTNTALAIAGGDLERQVETRRSDEIGLLGGAFNSMTHQINTLIEGLEARVLRRTSEISLVNSALKNEIAEREHTQLELRRSKDFAETVFDSLTESIAVVSMPDLEIVGGNNVFSQSGTKTIDEIPGITCYARKITDPGYCCSPTGSCPLDGIEAGQHVSSAEYTVDSGLGGVRHLEVSISPITGDTGEVALLVHVSRDITHRKLSEDALRERTEALEAALHELGQTQSQLLQAQRLEAIGGLAAGVAHEINTPIQYVGDNTRFVQDAFSNIMSSYQRVVGLLASNADKIDPDTQEQFRSEIAGADLDYFADEIPDAIAAALEGLQRVTDIVRALKGFSHPGGDELNPLDIGALVERTVAVSKNEWKYVAELSTDLDVELSGVPALSGPLSQALLVLIINAAQAISGDSNRPAGELGSITVKTFKEAGQAVIEVTDTGSGIPEDVRANIFDPFFTTKPVGTGSGQGLAIARSIVVNQHKGQMDFTSEQGVGTSFRIYLPLELVVDPAAA